jgi:MFS family permease
MFGARLGDRFGHRRVIVAGTAVYGVAAVVGATAVSVGVLAGARSLQGAAAAVSVPAALRLLTTVTAEGAQRRRAVAAWSAAGAAAGASGFVVGGVVTDLIGWRAVFWGYVPVAVVLAAAILRTVPRDRSGGAALALNVAGSALFTAAAMAFIVGTTLLPERGKAVAASVTLSGGALPNTSLPAHRWDRSQRLGCSGVDNCHRAARDATLSRPWLLLDHRGENPLSDPAPQRV